MSKANVLLVGAGGVGTIAALNLELGGLAQVTAVLRSNYSYVQSHGFHIKSVDHGTVSGWRPTQIVNSIPTIREGDAPYDYIVCTTKNIADVSPTLAAQIAPAVTPKHTVIVLLQNGLNIEKPIFAAFPENIVLSGISMIGVFEASAGIIQHDDLDILHIGVFTNPLLPLDVQVAAANDFVKIYSAGGKTDCSFVEDVGFSRWRKLIYNACLNSICAITGLDTGRIRLADGAIETLVRPAMEEIRAAALAKGYELPADIADTMINVDALELYLQPSMMVDVQKGNFIEFENILGEPLREGEKLGVSMPTLKVLYGLCKAIQWRTKEQKGMVDIPAKRETS